MQSSGKKVRDTGKKVKDTVFELVEGTDDVLACNLEMKYFLMSPLFAEYF